MTSDRQIIMREPCMCGHPLGRLIEKNGQDTVRCLTCDRFQYNAPRTETGRAVRSVRTVHKGIRPSDRSRILERDGYRCVLCCATGVPLHIGHIVSVEHGIATGLTDDELNHDENLIAECEECNLGNGSQPIPLRTAVAILRARLSWLRKTGAA